MIKGKGEDKNTVYHLIEGKQRLTNISAFMDDVYPLHSKSPTVVIDGVSHTLAEQKFSELDSELQDLIGGYRFTIYRIEDATDEGVEESFARLNSGTPPNVKMRHPLVWLQNVGTSSDLLFDSCMEKIDPMHLCDDVLEKADPVLNLKMELKYAITKSDCATDV